MSSHSVTDGTRPPLPPVFPSTPPTSSGISTCGDATCFCLVFSVESIREIIVGVKRVVERFSYEIYVRSYRRSYTSPEALPPGIIQLLPLYIRQVGEALLQLTQTTVEIGVTPLRALEECSYPIHGGCQETAHFFSDLGDTLQESGTLLNHQRRVIFSEIGSAFRSGFAETGHALAEIPLAWDAMQIALEALKRAGVEVVSLPLISQTRCAWNSTRDTIRDLQGMGRQGPVQALLREIPSLLSSGRVCALQFGGEIKRAGEVLGDMVESIPYPEVRTFGTSAAAEAWHTGEEIRNGIFLTWEIGSNLSRIREEIGTLFRALVRSIAQTGVSCKEGVVEGGKIAWGGISSVVQEIGTFFTALWVLVEQFFQEVLAFVGQGLHLLGAMDRSVMREMNGFLHSGLKEGNHFVTEIITFCKKIPEYLDLIFTFLEEIGEITQGLGQEIVHLFESMVAIFADIKMFLGDPIMQPLLQELQALWETVQKVVKQASNTVEEMAEDHTVLFTLPVQIQFMRMQHQWNLYRERAYERWSGIKQSINSMRERVRARLGWA